MLFRTAHHSAPLEVELARRDIPFVKFGGLKFLDAAHVKDVLACLRFAQNPADRIAGFRALQLVPGIGPATAEALLDAPAARAPSPRLADTAPPRAADWPAFRALYAALRARDHPAGPPRSRRSAPGTSPTSSAPTRRRRLAAPTSSSSSAIAAATPSRERFLTDVTLDPPGGDRRRGRPAAPRRGLSDPLDHPLRQGPGMAAVFVLNCVDGCIPSDLGTGTTAEIEEERRLLYVAMTRARDRAAPGRSRCASSSTASPRSAAATSTPPAPASSPTPCSTASTTLAWPPAEAPAAPGPRPQPRIDLKQQMRGLWT